MEQINNSAKALQDMLASIPQMERLVEGPEGDLIKLIADVPELIEDMSDVTIDLYVRCDLRRSALLDALVDDAEQINECTWRMRQGNAGFAEFDPGDLLIWPLEKIRDTLMGTQDLFLTCYAEQAQRVHE